MLYDVVVAGAGPAGSAAAIDLAKGGARTAILEGKVPPRYKTCGGGIVGRARKLLPVAMDGAVDRACHALQVAVLGTEIELRAEREEPVISMVMRDRFDHLLNEAARDHGATLLPSHRIRALESRDGIVRLETSAGAVAGRLLIAADGALGPVAKAAGWRDVPYLIPALEAEVTVEPRTFARHEHTARFDFGLIENGYAWVFPKAGHLSVGVLSTSRGGIRLPAMLERYYRLLGIAATIRDERRFGFVIPVRPRAAPFVRGRVVLVGDTAGLADPVTAEGISGAIHSGRLAASAVLASGESAGEVREAYTASLEREILADLRIARLASRLAYKTPRLRNALLRRHGRRIVNAFLAVFDGELTYDSIVREPRNYLKLLARPS